MFICSLGSALSLGARCITCRRKSSIWELPSPANGFLENLQPIEGLGSNIKVSGARVKTARVAVGWQRAPMTLTFTDSLGELRYMGSAENRTWNAD